MNHTILTDHTKITYQDIMVFLRVCSTYDTDKMLSTPNRWEAFWTAFTMRTLYKRPHLIDDTVRMIAEYMHENLSYPKIMTGEKNGADGGVPWVMSVVLGLIKTGFTEEEAWTMSEARAMWYASCIAIGKGAKLEVLSTDMEKMLDNLAKT